MKTYATRASFVENDAKTQGVLTVTDGTHTAHVVFLGDYSDSRFRLGTDDHGFTTVVAVPGVSAPSAQPGAAVHPFIASLASFAAADGGRLAPIANGGSSHAPLLALLDATERTFR